MLKFIYFFFDYRIIVGKGHINRSTEFAELMKKRFFVQPYFVEHYDYGNLNILTHNYKLINFQNIKRGAGVIVLDLVNTFNEICFIKKIINICHNKGLNIIFINGTGPFDVVNKISLRHGDLNISPFYKNFSYPKKSYKSITNISFNMTPFKFYKKRWRFSSQKDILLTSGNSDPDNGILCILNHLINLDNKDFDKIKVLVGTGFSYKLSRKLGYIQKKCNRVILLKNVSNIIPEVLKSRIVISADGLTKYELSVMRAPSIFFSLNKDGYLADKEFRKLNYGFHIGLAKKVEFKDIEKKIKLASSNIFYKNCQKISIAYFNKFGLELLGKTVWKEIR